MTKRIVHSKKTNVGIKNPHVRQMSALQGHKNEKISVEALKNKEFQPSFCELYTLQKGGKPPKIQNIIQGTRIVPQKWRISE
jgi:hypothetical protein